MTIEPLEVRLIEPGCFYIEMVKTSKNYRDENPKCNLCDGHKTTCKKYKEKSPIVKPADVSHHEQSVVYHC
jgi:hypothetical protein